MGQKLEYRKFCYDGPIVEFGKCITQRWIGYTYAPTKEKARSNLSYQYKKQHGRVPSAKITLPGRIKLAEKPPLYDGEQLSFL